MGAFKSIYTDYACEPSQTLVGPKLTLEANAAGSLEFSVLPGQDGYDNTYTRPRNGYLIVLKDGEPIWDGRVTTRDMDWNNTKSIYAEGALSYLNDIMIQSLEDTSDFKTARANAKTDLKKKESAYNKAKKEWEDGGSVGTGDLYNKYITAKKNLGCAKKNYSNCVYNANILDQTDDELLIELIEDDYYGENGPKIFEMMLEKYNAQAENSNVHNQFALGDVFVPAIHEAYEAVDEDDYLIEWDSPDFTTVYEYFSSMLQKIPNTYLSVTYEYDKNNLLVRKLNWLLQGVNKDNVETVKQYYNTNVKSAKTAYSTAAEAYNKWYVKAYDSAKNAEDIDAAIKSNSEYAGKHNPLVTATNNLKTVNAAWNTYIKHLVDYSSPDIVVKQTVNFGENLLDFKRNIDSTEMFTRLIPIGEDDLYLNDDKSSAAIYVQDNELVAQYGVITRKMNFDKIRDVKTLKQQAKAELAKMKARIDGSKESIEITALDLRYYDSTAYYGKSLNIYDVVDCISAPHGFLTSNKFPVLKEEIEMAQPENTKFTLNAIIEYQSATSQLASTSANTMATASTVSTLGSRQNSNIAYIDDGGGGGTGGNKIYTSKSAPDTTLGNEGDLWVKYHTENNDKFINSQGEEIDVDIPRYESDNDALSYVDTTIRPILRTIKDKSTSELSDIVKQFEKECTVVLYQTYFSQSAPGGVITSSQFPQLTIDTYTVNNQSLSVIQGNTIVTIGETAVTSRVIGSQAYKNFKYVSVDDFDNALEEDGGNWYVSYTYLYYNTTTKYLNYVSGYLSINWYYHTLPSDDLNAVVTNYSIDLVNTSVMVIDELYCKIDDDWVNYDDDGGSEVVVNQILQSGTEIAQISVNGEVVSIYAPGGNKVYTSTRVPTSSDTANEGDLWYQMNYSSSSAFDFPDWGYMLPLEYNPGNFRLEDVRSSLELRFYDTVNDIYLYYLFLGGTNYVIGYNRLGPTNTFDGFDKDTGELQVTTENEQGTAWSYWNYIPSWNNRSSSYPIANPLGQGHSNTAMSPNIGTTTYNLYSIIGYASKISSGEYRLDGFRLITNGAESSWQYEGEKEYNVITRWVYKENNWQVADYIAGDGVTIKNGIISANGSEIVQVNPIVTSGTQLATINGKSIYSPTTTVTQTLTEGTEIATINVGNASTKLYAPTTTVTQTLTEGTEIGEVNGTKLYAPTGGGSGGGGGSEVKRPIDWDNKVDITLPYTATADGYFCFRIYQGKCQFTINGVNIISCAEFDNDVSASEIYPISTGDVLELAYGTAPGAMWFVPLKETGSSPSSGHNYSTDEQVVGTWIDGSTVYEKTIVLSNAVSVPSGADQWTILITYADLGVDNFYNPINITCYQDYFAMWGCFSVQAYNENIYVQQNRGNAVTIDKFTIQYTKTS